MKKYFPAFILLNFLIVIFIGCQKQEADSPEDVINLNADYMSKEDISGVETTLDKDKPDFEQSMKMVKLLFDTYDLDYKIESLETVEQNENEAQIKFVQLTTKISGPEFRDNRFTGIHTLKKKSDGWKILSTKQLNIEFLD